MLRCHAITLTRYADAIDYDTLIATLLLLHTLTSLILAALRCHAYMLRVLLRSRIDDIATAVYLAMILLIRLRHIALLLRR